jgi:hypothetical protein
MRVPRNLKIAIAVSAAALLLLLFGLAPARSDDEGGVLYATRVPFSSTTSSQLAIINLGTRTVKVIGDMGYPLSAALAFCPGGVAYTVTNIFNEPFPSQLATLSLATGVAMPVGSPLPQYQDIMALVCSRFGVLYAVGGPYPDNSLSEYNTLYIINRATGQLSRVGFTGVNDATGDDMFMALRFAGDGTLYGANPLALYTIDPKNGLATKVVDFSPNVAGNVMGLFINGEGKFYLADYTPDSFVYGLDPHTGTAAPILDTGMPFVHSIASRIPF